MSLAGLIPTDVSINIAIAICAIAFVSGTARGFSGFGSALIFMPLASSMATPRLVAALLLIIDFVAAAPLVPNAWKHADRRATAVMVSGALVGVPIGSYFLSRLVRRARRRLRESGAKRSALRRRRCETRRSHRKGRRRQAGRRAIADRICARQIPRIIFSGRRLRDRLPSRSRSSLAPAARSAASTVETAG